MTFEDLKPWLEKRAALQHASGLLSFDKSCHNLKKALHNTGSTMNYINKELLLMNQDPHLIQLLNQLANDAKTSFEHKRIAEEWLKEIHQKQDIPTDLALEYRQAMINASSIWPQCKQENDWINFVPALQEVVRLRKEMAQCRKTAGQSLYDVMLEEYLPGYDTAILDNFFLQLRENIIPLLKKIQETKQDSNIVSRQTYDLDAQRIYVKDLIGRLGFDFESGDIFESEHPFTSHFHNHDVRFTNHYHTDNLHAIFSAIHETGHALYEMGIRDDISRSPLGSGTSTPMHEGQSRFYENMIGRNPLFWKNEYPRLQKAFPKPFKDISLDDYLVTINQVEPGLIRIMADELTYSLHIMIRYELEKEIINHDFDLNRLPEAWNDKVKEVLGLAVPNDTVGVLQDMHWGSGMFGYFPGYSLGSAVAAQLYATLKKDINIEKLIEQEDYAAIRNYLKENIHQYGKLYSCDELLLRITKEKFNPKYYIDYLKAKFER